MGAFGAFLFALARRALTWRILYAVLLESARTTAMLFMILIGALMFAEFVNITTMPADLKAFVTRFNVNPTLVVAAICAIYVMLGTAMEELSMILLTMPVFFPVIVHLGLRPDLVRHHHRVRGRDRPDQPAGRHEHLRAADAPARGDTGTVFSGVLPFMWADVLRLAHPGRVPVAQPLAAEPDALTPALRDGDRAARDYSRGAIRCNASAEVITGITSKSTRSLPAAIHWSSSRRSSHSIIW